MQILLRLQVSNLLTKTGSGAKSTRISHSAYSYIVAGASTNRTLRLVPFYTKDSGTHITRTKATVHIVEEICNSDLQASSTDYIYLYGVNIICAFLHPLVALSYIQVKKNRISVCLSP